jgi:hypothetical protein
MYWVVEAFLPFTTWVVLRRIWIVLECLGTLALVVAFVQFTVPAMW